MREMGAIDDREFAYASCVQPKVGNYNALQVAPHFCEFVHQRYGGSSLIETTLDTAFQQRADRVLERHLRELRPRGVTNGALVVLENATGHVLALCGSGNYHDVSAQGQINGALALRSPGSTLKPLMYAF